VSKKEETETLPFAAEFALSLRTVDDPTVLSQFPASKFTTIIARLAGDGLAARVGNDSASLMMIGWLVPCLHASLAALGD